MLFFVNEMVELFDIIDLIVIVEVCEVFICILVIELVDELLVIYNVNYQSEYCVEYEDIVKCILCNVCLCFFVFGEMYLVDVLVSKQFYEVNNMIDVLAVFFAVVVVQLFCCDVLMQEYDDKWYQNGLVMDKWFIL